MIKNLHISNYKSIKRLDISCSRINVLVGEPNVGKSNILEALNLSYLSWMNGINISNVTAGKEKIDLKSFFRVNKVADMFHLGNLEAPISITHPGFSIDTFLTYKNKENNTYFEWMNSNHSTNSFDNDFNPVNLTTFYGSPIHPYRYKSKVEFHDIGNYISSLMPPFGNNLINVISHNQDMKELLRDFADENNFELNLDRVTEKISIQLRINKGLVYTLPYTAMADTFKRILFYVAAVRHNNANVITLDEPDTHAFPKFVSYLADEIIKNKSCQFFIATHNPYLLNCLIENTPADELGVFVCGFNKSVMTTTTTKLSDQDLSELLDYGVDIFFNLNRYINDGIEHSA